MWSWHFANIPVGLFKAEHFSSANISATTCEGSRNHLNLILSCFKGRFGGTIVCVDAVGRYVHGASVQRPGQSERLSRVLDDPAARGEVVPGVIVAVPTKTWEAEWRPLQPDQTGLIRVWIWEADLRWGPCGLSEGTGTAGFVETPELGASGQARCALARTWRTPRKPERDLSKDGGGGCGGYIRL